MATSIIAEQDLSQDIYEANSGYRQYYGQMNFAKQANELGSAAGYNEAIGKAYMASQRQENLVAQSEYGTQGQRNLNQQLNSALSNAYDTYRSQHAQGVAETGQKVDASIGEVAGDLRKTGQELGSKYAQYQEGAFRWLEDLNQQGFLNKGGQFDSYEEYQNYFANNSYTQYLEDYANDTRTPSVKGPKLSEEEFLEKRGEELSEGEWRAAWANQQVFKDVFDAEGNINEDKLKTAIFSQLDEDGNIMKDEVGNPIITADLNTKGIEMLDKLNSLSSEEYGSYSSWLAKNNEELYQWSVQRAMLGNGTNAAAAMANMGADGMYSFMERFGGLSQQETEKLFGDFELITERVNMTGKWFNTSGDITETSKKNKEEFAKSTKVMTDLYQSLDIDNAVIKVTLEDGSIKDIPISAMITAQFAQATGINYEDAAKLLETGEFSTIKPNLSTAIDWGTGALMGGIAAGTAAMAAIAAAVSSTAAIAIGSAIAGTAAKITGVSLSAAATASAVPVVGWVVAGVALIGAAVAGGFAISETRKANVEGTARVNEQEGAIRTNFDQWAVQSASVAYEMRKKALANQ